MAGFLEVFGQASRRGSSRDSRTITRGPDRQSTSRPPRNTFRLDARRKTRFDGMIHVARNHAEQRRSPMAPPKHFPPPAGVRAPPLSYAARTGDLLFVSGIPGFDDQGGIPDSFEGQFGFVERTVKRVLTEAGATVRDLVKVNVLLTRAPDVAIMNRLYADAFGPPPYPARTTCVVQALPDPRMLIEIECVASLAAT
jgi:2-iminobutanoate/2-iminopropanoate deaminase